jgi:hypothetical protein
MSSEEKAVVTIFTKITNNEREIEELKKRISDLESKLNKLSFNPSLSDAKKRNVGIC